MVSFTSPFFFVFCLTAIFLLRMTSANALVMGALNLVFVASFIPAPLAALPLLGFVCFGYCAIRAARRFQVNAVLILLVAGTVFLFAWLKRYAILSFLPAPNFAYATIGISYILFRILHLVIDCSDGVLEPPPPLAFLNYVFFFPNFVSGPIQRYEDFHAQVSAPLPPVTWLTIHEAFGRLVKGYFFVVVASSAASWIFDHAHSSFYAALSRQDGPATIALFSVSATSYLVFLFTNFAGYMQIVIGVGQLAGFTLPENFNRPFASKNFLDFWARWHITLSNWFKFYLYNPLLKAMASRWGTRAVMPYLGVIGLFVTFLVMGMWHGSTVIYVAYGVFLGVGIAINQLWQVWMTNRLSAPIYHELRERPWYFQVSRGVTLGYFSVAITALWIEPEQANRLFSPFGLTVFATTIVILSALIAIFGTLVDAAFGRMVYDGGGTKDLDPPASGSHMRYLGAIAGCYVVSGAGLTALAFYFTPAEHPYSTAHKLFLLVLAAFTAFLIGALVGAFDKPIAHATSYFGNRREVFLQTWMAFRIFILAGISTIMASAIPEFIYRAF